MRKYILAAIVILFVNIANGQKFSLNELLRLTNYNWDEFDTYVTTKGYAYYTTKTKDFSETRVYAYNQGASNKAPYFIAKTIYTIGLTNMVAFQTMKNDEYLAIKNQLKAAGFKYINSETTEEGITFLNYKKETIEASLASFQSENNYGEMKTGYCKLPQKFAIQD